jgi:hypothetical protein
MGLSGGDSGERCRRPPPVDAAVPTPQKQILSLGEGPLALLPDSDAVLSLRYRAEGAPTGLSGLGFLLHFDSRQVSWSGNPARKLFEPGWRGPWPVLTPTAERPENSDGDPSTDQVLRFSYLDPSGRWPGNAQPLQLAELGLRTRPGFERTTLRLTALSTPPGTTFQAAPLLLRCPPRITAINATASQAKPWWAPGDGLDIQVQFSEVVQVSGKPTVELVVGGQRRSATYQGGSGSSRLLFRYGFAAGDQGSLRMDADALQLPAAATIHGLDGLAANLRHGPPALPNGRVDSAMPTVRMDPLIGVSAANSLNLSGTVTDSGGSGIASVLLWDGHRNLGKAVLKGSLWSFRTETLAEGLHSFRSEAIDAAGNRSTLQAAMAVTIDRTPPPPPRLVKTLGGDDRVVTAAAGDSALTAHTEPGCKVKLRIGSLQWDLQADEQGRVSWTPTLAQIQPLERYGSSQSLSLVATDRAGNSSAATTAALRLPQAVAAYGTWQVRLGSRENDILIGSASSLGGRLKGDAVFGGSGHDTLTGLALRRPGSNDWAVPLLCGGRGDDRYVVPEGSAALIADLGGAGDRSGRDSLHLVGARADNIALTLLDQSDLLITRRQPASRGEPAAMVLVLDALGRRRPDAGNRIETVQLGETSFNLRSDGALVNGRQVLMPRLASLSGSTGLLSASLDPDLDWRHLVTTLATGLGNQTLIG